MKAMMSLEPGGPESLTLQDVATPEPGPGQVRIGVRAAGVNFPDTLIIRDLYQFRPPRPFAPGSEIAGVIDAVGDGVEEFAPGDRVAAMSVNGGYATHFIAETKAVVKIPDAMPFDEAAGFLMIYGTSHYALKMRANLNAGETLLVLGAAGGVGAAAVELGKAMGAKVIAAVSSAEKAAFCQTLGADETFVYPKGDLDRDAQKAMSGEIKERAGGDGVDVVYDAVGGDYAEPALRAMAWEGRYLVIGFPAGIPSIPLNVTLLKNIKIVGVFWGAFTMRNPQAHAENVAELFNLYQAEKIRPRITAHFPLEEAAKALSLIESRRATGKIVLTVD